MGSTKNSIRCVLFFFSRCVLRLTLIAIISASLPEGLHSGDAVGIEQWNIFCYRSKQGCHKHQPLQPSTWSPEGTQGWKERLPSSSHRNTATPCSEHWRNSGCENTGYWPQRVEAHIIGMISDSPGSCLFSTREKPQIPWHTRFP